MESAAKSFKDLLPPLDLKTEDDNKTNGALPPNLPPPLSTTLDFSLVEVEANSKRGKPQSKVRGWFNVKCKNPNLTGSALTVVDNVEEWQCPGFGCSWSTSKTHIDYLKDHVRSCPRFPVIHKGIYLCASSLYMMLHATLNDVVLPNHSRAPIFYKYQIMKQMVLPIDSRAPPLLLSSNYE